MPQDISKSRANPPKAPIGKFEHQSGKFAKTLERFAPGEAGGWSDSPQGVERIAPLGSLPMTSIGNRAHESGIARTNREISARIGNGAHQSGNSSTNQESRARIGRGSGRAAREVRSIPDAIPVILAASACPPLSHRGRTSGPCPRLRSSALSGPPQSWIPFPSAAQTVRMRGALRCRAWWPCGSRSRGGESGSRS